MYAQNRAKYVKEQIIPKAPNLEFIMIVLAGGFSEEESGVRSMYYHNHGRMFLCQNVISRRLFSHSVVHRHSVRIYCTVHLPSQRSYHQLSPLDLQNHDAGDFAVRWLNR